MAPLTCTSCGEAHPEEGWEFAFGALAGEVYHLGESVHFEEAFSFFDQRVGSPQGRHTVEATAVCSSCHREQRASLTVEDAVLMSLQSVESGDRV